MSLGQTVLAAPMAPRDVVAAESAITAYHAAFERLDRIARALRAERWADGAASVQEAAEVAYFAARAERRALEGTS